LRTRFRRLRSGVFVFVVKGGYGNAVLVPKIERAITKHGEIISQTYLNAPDKNYCGSLGIIRNRVCIDW